MERLSERVKMVLRSHGLTDNQLGQILNEGRAWRLVYEINEIAKGKRAAAKLPEICFTGFTEATRLPLWEVAEAHGFVVKEKVNKGCKVLVTGPNAGPSKIEKAKAQGCKIITEEEFRAMISEREDEVLAAE